MADLDQNRASGNKPNPPFIDSVPGSNPSSTNSSKSEAPVSSDALAEVNISRTIPSGKVVSVQTVYRGDRKGQDEMSRSEAVLTHLSTLKNASLKWVNPAYHVKGLLDDLKAVGTAINTLRSDSKNLSHDELVKDLRGRLVVGRGIGDLIGYAGIGLSAFIQYKTKNPLLALGTTMAVEYLFGASISMASWLITSKNFYKQNVGDFSPKDGPVLGRILKGVVDSSKRTMTAAKDHLPVLKRGLQGSLGYYGLSGAYGVAVTMVLTKFLPELARNFPVALQTSWFEHCVCIPIWMRFTGDFYQTHASNLIKKYCPDLIPDQTEKLLKPGN